MKFFLMFMQLAPHIITLVKQTEELIPVPGKGKEKLELVLNTVNAGVQGSAEVASAVAGHDLNAAVTTIVNAAVATAKAAGAFK